MTRLKEIRESKGISQKDFAAIIGVPANTYNQWEKGKRQPDPEIMIRIADYYGVTMDYLLGRIDESTNRALGKIINGNEIQPNAVIDTSENHRFFMIPVFESVSAGFGAFADDYITEYMPMYFTNPKEAEESIFVTVKGDSMYPKIEDGDIVLVHKQSSVDSGTIAVVLLDETEALVKKIVYGDTWIELRSVNPMYPVMRFDGKDVLRIQVLGMVKKIIKSV